MEVLKSSQPQSIPVREPGPGRRGPKSSLPECQREEVNMKRHTTLLVGLVVGVAVALLTVLGGGGGTALADGGPHVVQAGATPDKCASCHRIHTGQNDYLLKEAGTVEDFCYSCHGDGGPGSDLAVSEGTFYGG